MKLEYFCQNFALLYLTWKEFETPQGKNVLKPECYYHKFRVKEGSQHIPH